MISKPFRGRVQGLIINFQQDKHLLPMGAAILFYSCKPNNNCSFVPRNTIQTF